MAGTADAKRVTVKFGKVSTCQELVPHKSDITTNKASPTRNVKSGDETILVSSSLCRKNIEYKQGRSMSSEKEPKSKPKKQKQLSNAQFILQEIVAKEKNATAPQLAADKFFEIFSAEQILKDYGLSDEEIRSGIVGGGDDGGVDSIFTFVNGVLATEDADYSNIKEGGVITLIIIQSKRSPGISAKAISTIEDTVEDLLNLGHELRDYATAYNTELIRAVKLFRNAHDALLNTYPKIEFKIYYAFEGDEVHPNVIKKSERLKNKLANLLTGSITNVEFKTASKILELCQKSRSQTVNVHYKETLESALGGSVFLIALSDYFDFICETSTGDLRAWLFEENIRDYEGRNVEVNKKIRHTLENPKDSDEFWWLNNGITIIAERISPGNGKILAIKDPKIVNGLQTSTEIYNYFHNHKGAKDNRNILVRAIQTSDEKVREAIIVATNSQSAINPASLRAFEPIQAHIEQYFKTQGLYYERRKNYYKNQAQPKDKIISIRYLAQAVAAILLQRPNDSRGRPLSLIINPTTYDKIFNNNHPIEIYLECLQFMRYIDEFLASSNAPSYVKGHELNIKYYLAMVAAAVQARRVSLTPQYIKSTGLGKPQPDTLTKCLNHIWELLQTSLQKDAELTEDEVAKSIEFEKVIKERLRQIIKKEIVL